MKIYIVSSNSCDNCYEGPRIEVFKNREEIVKEWITEYCDDSYEDDEIAQERLEFAKTATAEDILNRIVEIRAECDYHMNYLVYEV